MAYRAMPHNATKFSPAEVMFGRNITLPADLSRPPPPDATDAEDDPALYPAWLRERLRDLHEEVRRNMTTAQCRAKDHYDAAGTFNPVQEGQEVWLYAPRRRVGRNPKLECPWEGPYRVERAINDVVMEIRPLFETVSRRRARNKIVHADRLAPRRAIPALSRQIPRQQQS
ncbi:Retrovirus-related Pol polyprotein from transposon 412 [Frankliniella fusca]|uniref:Retrovirus-related Pol polyprotein from transposon 412 n=1 Tax=Frankliniella fusca TaxID=407009 RepID=A0AAE1I3K4_9NEOP|nr:Retrovirus-related Pol polyprotein from transposon 412 [Frankliniella fusca]